ncbi:MAG TPA: aminomethyl-transferring glycine dehydrogenase subunit GcvPB [Euzebyales bacterium]
MTVMGPHTATEPTLFERSRPGRRASELASVDVDDVDLAAALDGVELAEQPPALPEIAELDLLRHFTRMSQRNHGIDAGFYPLGSCSMKYNPRIAERVAALRGFAAAHPWAPASAVQGTLGALWELERWLTELTGLHAATLQPAAGAQGELVGLLLIRAYHEHRDEDRDTIIIPDSAHGTNPASATIAGFETVTVPSGDDGLVDVDALEKLVDDRTAGLMLTNPNTLGLFEMEIERIAAAVHDAGGLLYYDGANFNAIAGRVRPGDMGFDVVHLNVHKTFATPHGGGGPGAGPVVVSEVLAPYLPTPVVIADDGPQPAYHLEWDRPRSIGRVHGFHGNTGVLLRALSYLQRHGGDGLASMSAKAVLNANYLAHRTSGTLPLAYPQHPPMHEFVLRGTAVREHGVRVLDVCKRLIDLGYHPPTNYFPLIVDEALMIEPTETETPETLDGFAAALDRAVSDAADDADLLHDAPVTTPVRRLDEAKAARELVLRWVADDDA